MKFVRNGKVRDRIVDVVAKGILIAFSALVCLWMVSGARAAGGADISEIRQKALQGGAYAVEFVLSKPIPKEDVSVEFQRNFIQVSLKGVSAYPARTQKLKHDRMEKVFTYQYQPDMARARLLLKGEALAVKSESSWEIEGNTVRIQLNASVPSSALKEDSIKTVAASSEAKTIDEEEQSIRNQILRGESAASTPKKVDAESLPVFGAQTTPGAEPGAAAASPESKTSKVLASLLLVLGVIGAGTMAFRRFVLGRGLGFQRQGRMIEVISTQPLGPKRSIAVVKVIDQYMVVGMSGDGMTLLSNLGANVNLDRYMDEAGPGASFTETLQNTLSGGRGETAPVTHRESFGFRASLKKRLEGFKPL